MSSANTTSNYLSDFVHLEELQVIADFAADSGCTYLEKELRERIATAQNFKNMIEAAERRRKERELAGEPLWFQFTPQHLPSKSSFDYEAFHRQMIQDTARSIMMPKNLLSGWPERREETKEEKE